MADSIFFKVSGGPEAKKVVTKYNSSEFGDIIQKARSGDTQAIFYLIVKTIKAISFAYNKYYIPNCKMGIKEEYDAASTAFFSTFYTKLVNATLNKGSGPIHTFNKDLFDKQDTEFLMKKFSFRMFRYAQYVITGINQKEYKIKTNEIVSTDYNASISTEEYDAFENLEDTKLAYEVPEGFIQIIKNHSKKSLYRTLDYMLKGYNVPAIAKIVGVSREWVYNDIRKMKILYKEYSK